MVASIVPTALTGLFTAVYTSVNAAIVTMMTTVLGLIIAFALIVLMYREATGSAGRGGML